MKFGIYHGAETFLFKRISAQVLGISYENSYKKSEMFAKDIPARGELGGESRAVEDPARTAE